MSRLATLVLLLVACQAVFAEKIDYRLPTNVEPESYDLRIKIDDIDDTDNFTGEVSIVINVKEKVNEVVLHAGENIDIVLQPTITPGNNEVISWDKKSRPELVILKLKTPIEKGKYTLKIKYNGKLNDAEKRGFYRSRYFDKDGKVRYIATTHFEPTGARLAFPCWDEPAFKAQFTISVDHLKIYHALSNMKENKFDDGGERQITRFEKSPKMSTYLVAFVVSDYQGKTNGEDKNENKNKILHRVWTKPHAVEQTKYALEMGEKLLDELNNYTNLGYKEFISKMDQVTVKDFTPSAMENWGLVTYRETALLYEEGVTTTRSKHSITTVIAHEFAHQWFGNIVSPKWWKYIWLNEGFANYMQHFVTHKVVKDWRLDERFVVDNMQGNAFIADTSVNARPMNQDAQSPAEINSLFDSIGYQKAGSVIRMMSHILTPEIFQKGLQEYLKKHQTNVATSDDLFESLQQATNKTWEGKTLKEIMAEWVNTAGYPVVTFRREDKKTFNVTQRRFFLHGEKEFGTWWVPLTYMTESSIDETNTEPVQWLSPDKSSTKKTIENLGEEDWILVNVLQTGYYRVNYDEDNWEKLENYLKKNATRLPPVNRAQLIDDALNLARAKYLDYKVALSLSTYLHTETDYIPWTAAFRNMNFLYNMMSNSKRSDIFKTYVNYITHELVKKIGFEKKSEESDLDKLLRVNVMKWACRFNVEECVEYAKKQHDKWIEDPQKNKLDVDLRNTILCAGVRVAEEDKWNKTYDKIKTIKDEDEMKSMLQVLACSESDEILEKYLNQTIKSDSKIRFDTAVQAVLSEHPNKVKVAMKVLLNKYEEITTLHDAGDILKRSAESIGNSITNNDQYLELTKFLASKNVKLDLQTIAQKAVRNIKWMESNQKVVESWLKDNEKSFNSASSVAFASLLLVLSVFLTRFY